MCRRVYIVLLCLCMVSVSVLAQRNRDVDGAYDTAKSQPQLVQSIVDTLNLSTPTAMTVDSTQERERLRRHAHLSTPTTAPWSDTTAVQHTVVERDSSTAVVATPKRWESLLNWNFIAVPTVSYQPETNWAFGVAAQYYFHCKEQPRNSEVGLDAVYTLNRQYQINLFTTTYFNASSGWELNGRICFRSYPDYFYGVGNQLNSLLDERLFYGSNMLEMKTIAVKRISGSWRLGPAFNYRFEQVTKGEELLTHDDETGRRVYLNGVEKYHMIGLGVCAQYDTRNSVNYATRGLFFKTVLLYYEPIVGSSYRAASLNVDLRHFVPIYRSFSFAWQFAGNTLIGKQKPFEMLPSIGGMDIVRGVRSGVWRDDLSLALQAELRIPIWRFLKASVFTSVGDVYNYKHWQWSVPKIGYGAGLRVTINKSKINLRFDVARQNYGSNWSYYITVKEAF